jgi:outer membrane protein OmpA-like peptidoglycan-associated protein
VWNNQQGGTVAIDDFRDSDLQLWKVTPTGGGKYSIVNKGNNMALNISGGFAGNGGAVIVWPYTASGNDQFFLLPAKGIAEPYWENLGPEVNSSRSDYAPCFSPDGKTLYFSRGDTKGMYIYNSEVYRAELKADGTWGNVTRMPEFDFQGNGRVVSFMPGGNEVVLFGDFTGGNDMFSIMERTAKGWSNPRPMGIRKPNIKYNSWTGYLASDGRTFIIEMNLTDRNNESDMYVCRKDDQGKWSDPMYMGDVLNTPRVWDGTPYLSPDMTTLYFNSNREFQQGTDIYMSKRLDDTWLKWSEPIKVDKGYYAGSIIQNYCVPGDGTYGYFASGMKSFGEGDLFRMRVQSAVKPEPFLVVNGKTLNRKTNQPVSSRILFDDLEANTTAGEVLSHPLTGEYQIMLPKGHTYGIYAESEGYYAMNERIDLKELAAYETIDKNIYLTPVAKGESIRLNNVFFDFGKATLRAESFAELDRVVALMKENPKLAIQIQGHTDNVGDDAANLTLSENRARTVMEYLLKHEVKSTRVSAKGFGETQPLNSNATDTERQENRRVVFVIE